MTQRIASSRTVMLAVIAAAWSGCAPARGQQFYFAENSGLAVFSAFGQEGTFQVFGLGGSDTARLYSASGQGFTDFSIEWQFIGSTATYPQFRLELSVVETDPLHESEYSTMELQWYSEWFTDDRGIVIPGTTFRGATHRASGLVGEGEDSFAQTECTVEYAFYDFSSGRWFNTDVFEFVGGFDEPGPYLYGAIDGDYQDLISPGQPQGFRAEGVTRMTVNNDDGPSGVASRTVPASSGVGLFALCSLAFSRRGHRGRA